MTVDGGGPCPKTRTENTKISQVSEVSVADLGTIFAGGGGFSCLRLLVLDGLLG